MLQTLRLYWEILWRRRPPSDLPYSMALCAGTILLFVIVSLGLETLGERLMPPAKDAPRIDVPPPMFVLIVLLTITGYSLLLRAMRFTPRIVQMLTASFGVALVVLPAQAALVMLAPAAGGLVSGLDGLLVMAVFAISIYVLYVQGWILSNTIEKPTPVCVVLVLVVQVSAFLLAALVLGVRLVAPAAGA